MSEGDRILKFKLLKLMKQKQVLLNKRELAKSEKLKLLEELGKLKAEAEGEDNHDKKKDKLSDKGKRLKDLNYSIDEIEKWDEKMQQKQEGFQNFEQLAELAFMKQTAKMEIDQELYNEQKKSGQSGMDFLSVVPKDKINKVVKDYKEMSLRKLQKMNKKHKSNNTSSFINEKNKQFNEKLDRHYGKYTKELKDSMERGTAL